MLKLAVKRRDGIFGAAEKMIRCLKNLNTLRWVALPVMGFTELKASNVSTAWAGAGRFTQRNTG
jgi:hypothetical protein